MADLYSYEYRPFGRYTFLACSLVADKDGGLCPRHKLMTEIYGPNAENIEHGYFCDWCEERRMDDPPLPCYKCAMNACSVCRHQSTCCEGMAAQKEAANA